MRYYKQEKSHAGERQKYCSPVEKLPPDQPKIPTNHKMQIHRKPQVHLVLGLPYFQEDFNSKASTAPARPLKISATHITPLPSVAKAASVQEKKQETSKKASMANAPERCRWELATVLASDSDSQQDARQLTSNTIFYFYLFILHLFINNFLSFYQCLA